MTTRDVSAVLTDALRTLRELELLLKFFNMDFADALWAYKVLFLIMTILAGFSSIRLMRTNPILGCLYTYMCLLAIILYVGMFQFAYKVTEKIEKLTEVMEVKSASLVNLIEKKYWKKRFKSIPRMGMKLSGFNRVEREAVPIFVDFCVKQIVTLLITFK